MEKLWHDLGIQVFVTTGEISGLIPMTGLSMPLMSAGDLSLLANYLIIALVLRISHSTRTSDAVLQVKKAPRKPLTQPFP